MNDQTSPAAQASPAASPVNPVDRVNAAIEPLVNTMGVATRFTLLGKDYETREAMFTGAIRSLFGLGESSSPEVLTTLDMVVKHWDTLSALNTHIKEL